MSKEIFLKPGDVLMKAYSTDLRTRILSFLRAGHSIRKTAQHFLVSPDCVFRLKKRYEQTQSILPKQQGGYMKPKIDTEGEAFLHQKLAQNNSCTLVDLCEIYHQERGVSVKKSAMHRTLKRLGITFKKKAFMTRHKTANGFKN
jgi:transposase